MSSPSADSLLEHLPSPCIFVTSERSLLYANKAARQLAARHRKRKRQHATDLSIGRYFLDDDLLASLGLPVSYALKPCMQQLAEQEQQQRRQIDTGSSELPPAIALPPLRDSIASWTLSCYRNSGHLQFSFTAPPFTRDVSEAFAQDTLYSTEEEDWKMLKDIVEPTMETSKIMCSIMSASQKSHELNSHGRKFLSGEEQYPWTKQHDGVQFENILMDSAFTRALPAEEGAAITSLSKGESFLNLRRGLANTRSGDRTVFNATTVLLNKPNSREPLGVIVCVEPEEFSLYLQRCDSMNHITSSINSSGSWNRARLVRAITLQGDVDYVSAVWVTYTGVQSPAALQGAGWLNVIHPDDHKKVTGLDSAASQSREREIRCKGHDGIYRWFSDRIEPFFNEEGRLVRWYAISDDVNDLVIQREKARNEKILLNRILAELDVTSVELDMNFIVQHASGTIEFEDLVTKERYNSQNIVGLNLLDFLDEDSSTGVHELRSSLVAVMNGASQKEICEYAFGPKFMRTVIVPLTTDDGSAQCVRGLLATSVDLSVAKEFSEVKAQMQVMEETNRLKSQFLANISHELRTPIAGFSGLVELLLETPLNDLQTDYLQCIQSSSRSLLQIVNDILDYSRAETAVIIPESIPFSLALFLRDISRNSHVLAVRKGLSFSCQPLDSDIELLGDTGRIRQILDNLITNAIKFTSNGYVKLAAEFCPSDDLVRVEFRIEDSGIGIDQQDLEKLFLPFVQADQSTTRIYGGSGLGLSIARKMAEIMGGSVSLESRKGYGTKANVVLHLAPAVYGNSMWRRPSFSLAADAALDTLTNGFEKRALTPAEKTNLHILFVEDNEINRKVILAHLSALGFRHVHAAKNGLEAVEYVASRGTRLAWPDLVIIDCQMPIMDGWDATRTLRSKLNYDRPVIALTASAIAGDREHCLEAGMDDHVAKPVNRRQLADLLNKWALLPDTELAEMRQKSCAAAPD